MVRVKKEMKIAHKKGNVLGKNDTMYDYFLIYHTNDWA